MQIALIVEGKTEDGLKELVRKLIPSQWGIKTIKLHGNNLAKLDKKVANLLEEKVSAVFIILDLREFPFSEDASRRKPIPDRIKQARREILKKIPKKYRKHVKVHFAVMETEAWMLADEKALSKKLGIEIKPFNNPENINDEKPPQSHLEDLFWRYKKKIYKKSVDGPDLLKKLDPQVVEKKCPNFKALANDLRRVCGPPSQARAGKRKSPRRKKKRNLN